MERKFVVKPNEMEVVDGKVVISSEELAAAIQNQGIDMDSEDSASFCDIVFGNKCTK